MLRIHHHACSRPLLSGACIPVPTIMPAAPPPFSIPHPRPLPKGEGEREIPAAHHTHPHSLPARPHCPPTAPLGGLQPIPTVLPIPTVSCPSPPSYPLPPPVIPAVLSGNPSSFLSPTTPNVAAPATQHRRPVRCPVPRIPAFTKIPPSFERRRSAPAVAYTGKVTLGVPDCGCRSTSTRHP